MDCTSCSACEPECPNNAITEAEDIFVIDPDLCTECVGFNEAPACVDACPVDCCVDDPEKKESEAVLLARAIRLHPDDDFNGVIPSRYNKVGS